LETNMRLIVESPRTDPESAALAIPITPESRTGRVAMARSENELSFWVFCDVADVWFDGVERMLENPSAALKPGSEWVTRALCLWLT
jgi:hypothetical protein